MSESYHEYTEREAKEQCYEERRERAERFTPMDLLPWRYATGAEITEFYRVSDSELFSENFRK